MKNGFTLVELLAVIVILAVIALIATPIVLSIINDTKESAVIRSAEMYVGAVENKIMQENMIQGGKLNPKECTVNSDGNVTCDGTYLEIEVNGDKPDWGLITYDRGRVTGITLTFGERKAITRLNGELMLDNIQELPPGLYDADNNLIVSWEELVNSYGLNVEDAILKNVTSVIEQFDSASKLVISEGIVTIGNSAFYESLLTDVVIPDSVTIIENDAFLFSENLTSVILGNGVTSIGSAAFADCTSLMSITIPATLTSIDLYAFYNTNLTSIKVDKNNPKYDSRDNSNAIIETSTNKLLVGSNNTVIPEGVTSIDEAAFTGRKNLTSIRIPASVMAISIDGLAFEGCTNLNSIVVDENNPKYDSRNNSNSIIETATNKLIVGSNNTVIPSSVTSIGMFAFAGRTALKTITIPNSVTSIVDDVFYGCDNLTTIYYSGTATGAPWGATNATVISDY